jgi:hypothetical protein
VRSAAIRERCRPLLAEAMDDDQHHSAGRSQSMLYAATIRLILILKGVLRKRRSHEGHARRSQAHAAASRRSLFDRREELSASRSQYHDPCN